jgi:hypothetical protein
MQAARIRLQQRSSKAVARVVINVDSDQTASGASVASGLKLQDVLQMVRTFFDPTAAFNPANEIDLDGGATRVSVVRWEAAEPPTPGLPDQQTLERLTSAALAAAFPGRGSAVHSWLGARPIPPAVDPKEHAWSYMAGWYAEHGCEAFYSNLWKDPAVVAELEVRLRAAGAWQSVALLTA